MLLCFMDRSGYPASLYCIPFWAVDSTTCNSFHNIRASVGATGVFKVIMTTFHRLNILSRGKRKNLNCPWGDYLDHFKFLFLCRPTLLHRFLELCADYSWVWGTCTDTKLLNLTLSTWTPCLDFHYPGDRCRRAKTRERLLTAHLS